MGKKKPDLRKVNFLLMDLDGCLSTGHIIYLSDGVEMKMYHTHDGYGITRGKELGMKFAVISGKSSRVNKMRTDRLGIDHIYEDVADKTLPYRELKEMYSLKDENFAYIGDDEFDIPLLKLVGFSSCPKSAIDRVKKHVHYVCRKNGGDGAVREVIDMILKARKLI